MPTTSAGILLYRETEDHLEVLLVHPGGPWWQHRDEGAWSIPKGEVQPDEEPLERARTELREETGLTAGDSFIELAPVRQKVGKLVRAWACPGDADPTPGVSNTFTMEWPPNSGQHKQFPEVDQACFVPYLEARRKINPGQVPLLDELYRELRRHHRHSA